MVVTRISADDAMELAADRRARPPIQLGALLELDPDGDGVADAQEVARVLRRRLATVPQLGRRLERARWGVGRPHWVRTEDEPRVGVVEVDPAGPVAMASGLQGTTPRAGERRLLDHFADMVTTRLPPDRPLWRAEVLADARGRPLGVALVAHHVVTDGIGGLSLLDVLADPVADAVADSLLPTTGAPPATGAPPVAGMRPTAGVQPASRAGAATGDVGRRTRGQRLRRVLWAARELGIRRTQLADRCSLLQPTGPWRRLEVVDVELARVKAVAGTLDATVNDVVLLVVSGALTRLLEHRHDRVRTLVASVPVSAREAGRELGNAVAVLPVRIPAVGDPQVRLKAIRAAKARLAEGRRGSSSALLGPAFRLLATVGAVQWFVTHQRLVHTFETNVRGPVRQLSVAGAPVRRIVPMAVNPGNVTVSFGILSAGGRLVLAVVTDPDHVPDHEVLVDAVTAELDLLLGREARAARGEGEGAGR
ncbi:wax ester/triacylglycerol synthase domain-containing protein [Pedococcus sp. NPDC057267]|uniref:wax ester/triacylglycerol synthase domain-containing protein n=1 Tax=Pedococcus sp. NPDC057267 TaxID=3346077 RepID=UPI00362ED021